VSDDLASLKIDRSAKGTKPKRRRAGGNPWMFRIGVLVVLATVVALFFRPISRFVDRFRLPAVSVAEVVESHPAAIGAVQGAAANGYIIAKRRAALSADTPGRIVELNVTEGSVLTKGDVVARLYFKEYEASLERANADRLAAAAEVVRALAAQGGATADRQRRQRNEQVADAQVKEALAQAKLAQTRLDRAKKLVEQDIGSQDSLDAAKAERDSMSARVMSARARLQAAQADVEDSKHQIAVASASLEVARARVSVAKSMEKQAAATLEKTFVRAPFDGIVVLKDAEVGEVVSPNSQGGSNARGSVCTMVDFDSLEVQADVPETNISSVIVGGAARIYLDAYPERTYLGKVSRIWPTGNRQKASIEVRVVFEQRDRDLRPDMGVRVVFLTEAASEIVPDGAKKILVPEDAVIRVDGKTGVFVLERDVVRFTAIDSGEKRAGQIHVLRGLTPGERIVLSPPPDLETGDRVIETAK
jgi:HlyD family secretion protein